MRRDVEADEAQYAAIQIFPYSGNIDIMVGRRVGTRIFKSVGD